MRRIGPAAADGKSILGYYTLSSTTIDLRELPADLARKLPKYAAQPATLIGRLAVDQSQRGKRLGEFSAPGRFTPQLREVFVISTGPSIASGGVVNGATFLPGIAPGTWITVQGANLSATTRTWRSADFSGNNLPSQLDGVSITVSGEPAYVYYISPTQVNALTPDDATQGSVSVQVTTGQGKSNVVNAVEAALSPGLFTFSAQGRKYVSAVRADGAYIGPTLPAKPGETVLLYGTGFGPTTPPSPIGQLVDAAPLANQVTVRIGGIAANTQFAGMVSPGLYQFNVTVPSVPSGDNAVWVEIGGGISQSNAFLTVQR